MSIHNCVNMFAGWLPECSSILVHVSTAVLCWPTTGGLSGTIVGTAMAPAAISDLQQTTMDKLYSIT